MAIELCGMIGKVGLCWAVGVSEARNVGLGVVWPCKKGRIQMPSFDILFSLPYLLILSGYIWILISVVSSSVFSICFANILPVLYGMLGCPNFMRTSRFAHP